MLKPRLAFLAALVGLASSAAAHAVARPGHDHEDLFGEQDILLGLKAGPQLNGYTAVNTPTAHIDVQSSMRAVWGASAQFIYGLPRFEVDVLWNARANINTADTYHSLAVPILAKLPWEIDPAGVDVEFGAGYQPEFTMFGAKPYRSTRTALVGSLGLAVDLTDFVFSFEGRYVYGLETIADEIDGAKPRDFQMIVGVAWHI